MKGRGAKREAGVRLGRGGKRCNRGHRGKALGEVEKAEERGLGLAIGISWQVCCAI